MLRLCLFWNTSRSGMISQTWIVCFLLLTKRLVLWWKVPVALRAAAVYHLYMCLLILVQLIHRYSSEERAHMHRRICDGTWCCSSCQVVSRKLSIRLSETATNKTKTYCFASQQPTNIRANKFFLLKYFHGYNETTKFFSHELFAQRNNFNQKYLVPYKLNISSL